MRGTSRIVFIKDQGGFNRKFIYHRHKIDNAFFELDHCHAINFALHSESLKKRFRTFVFACVQAKIEKLISFSEHSQLSLNL